MYYPDDDARKKNILLNKECYDMNPTADINSEAYRLNDSEMIGRI